jgi:cyclopropane fatty-acyl-phospholipid synthase-like methyltransferase
MIVIILVHDQERLTRACFESIVKSNDDKTGVKVVVVDNASDNGQAIKDMAEGYGFEYRRNEENKWFTEANAEVIAAYPGEDVYMLNNDTEVEDGWLSGRELLEGYGALGAVQTVAGEPRFYQFLGGEDNFAGHKVAWDWRAGRDFAWGKDGVLPAQWLTGAAMMINRKAYDAVGGLDLALKHYCSDSDLSLRLAVAGYGIGVLRGMRVMHHGSITYFTMAPKDPRFQQQGLQDQYNFARKHRVQCGQFDFRADKDSKTVYDGVFGDDMIRMRNIEASRVEADGLLAAFPGLKGWSVLELGCAWGEVVRYLREAGADAYGIDNSDAAANGYAFVVKDDILKHVFDSKAGSGLAKTDEYDFVFSKAVLEHLPEENIPGLLATIRVGLLKPGGLTHHNIDTVHGNDPTHVCIHDIGWWVKAFEAAGFETVETRHIVDGVYWATWRKT